MTESTHNTSPNDKRDRLLEEICQQPDCLRNLIAGFTANTTELAMPGFFTQKLIGIGEGSSFNALKIAAPYIEEFTGLNTFTFDPESLENKFEIARDIGQPVKRLFERSFFLTVSQSGQTKSILTVMSHLQTAFDFDDKHCPMLAFTNNPDGELSKRYGKHFPLNAGEEKSIAATKSMTASIMALLLFGIRLGQKRSWLQRKRYETLLDELADIPETLGYLFSDDFLHQSIQRFVTQLSSSNQMIVLSKGILSGILPEAGLKLTETSSNIVWTDNTESFKHGRKVILKGVGNQTPNCIYLVPPELSPDQAQQFYQDMESHFIGPAGEIVFNPSGLVLIRFENSPILPQALKETLSIAEENILTLPESSGIESLFVALGAFQLVCYYLALSRGEDPNNAALQKAVT